MASTGKKFSIDADVLIQSHRERMPLDVAPGFWEGLEDAGRAGRVVVIRSVFKEIASGGDELAAWIREREALFVEEDRDQDTQLQYVNLTARIADRKPPYRTNALEEFFGKADSWLVAQAAAHDYVVVTQEAMAPDGLRQVKIPDACALLEVPCIKTIELIRTLGIKLIRG